MRRAHVAGLRATRRPSRSKVLGAGTYQRGWVEDWAMGADRGRKAVHRTDGWPGSGWPDVGARPLGDAALAKGAQLVRKGAVESEKEEPVAASHRAHF